MKTNKNKPKVKLEEVAITFLGKKEVRDSCKYYFSGCSRTKDYKCRNGAYKYCDEYMLRKWEERQ